MLCSAVLGNRCHLLLPLLPPPGNHHKPSKDTRRRVVPFPQAPVISRNPARFSYAAIVCMHVTVDMLMRDTHVEVIEQHVWSPFLPPFCDTASLLFLLCAPASSLASSQFSPPPPLPGTPLALNRGAGVQTQVIRFALRDCPWPWTDANPLSRLLCLVIFHWVLL